jgi:hypothetical protein
MSAELVTKNAPALRPLHSAPRRGTRPNRDLYLVSDELGVVCPLLPTPLTALAPRIGWTWVDPDSLLPHHRSWCKGQRIRDPGNFPCPLREPGLLGNRAALLWIDDTHYPSSCDWIADACVRGPSLRTASVPDGFALRETWVLVAHARAFGNAPGIVHLFQPARLEEDRLRSAGARAWDVAHDGASACVGLRPRRPRGQSG